MAFYQFLAIFPCLLVLIAISRHISHTGGEMKNLLQDFSGQVLPAQVLQLLQRTGDQLENRALSGIQFMFVCAGTLWASFNATWAMVYGLNRAYEIQEHRSWWRLGLTIAGLTVVLSATALIALFFIFIGAWVDARLQTGVIGLRVVEWIIAVAGLLLAVAVLYRFAPDLRDHEWRWSTPGALCALLLWIAASFVARAYFNHVNDYSRTYGQLNSVVMLLLWLYVTNGAILIGGEMNSEIEKAAAERGDAATGRRC